MDGSGAIEIAGLNEALRGLDKVQRGAAKEVRDIIRDETKTVALAARKVAARDPVAPSSTNWITWASNTRGAGVKLRANAARTQGRAYYSEFGAHTHPVGFKSQDMYKRPQRTLRRRTTRPYRGDNKKVLSGNTGYIIQPTIRRMMPQYQENLANRLLVWMGRVVERGR